MTEPVGRHRNDGLISEGKMDQDMLDMPVLRCPKAKPQSDARSKAEGDGRLSELTELLSGSGNPEQHGARLAETIARALDAHYCAITFLADENGGKDRTYANRRQLQAISSRATVLAPIRCEGKVIGSLEAGRSASQRDFSDHDRELAQVVTSFLGRSLQVFYLRNLLNSRFARVAVAEGGQGSDLDGLLKRAVFPKQMVKLLARSFYRELRKAGFTQAQIIDAASEIIAQVTEMLKGQPGKLHASPGAAIADG